MKRALIGFIAIILLAGACREELNKKPKKLISRNNMIEMLVDMHLAEAVFQTRRYSSGNIKQYSESDYYYSVLKKYKVADSTFEQSLIFYSNSPKEYEKIYSRILNKLNEMEQEQANQKNKPVDIGNTSAN